MHPYVEQPASLPCILPAGMSAPSGMGDSPPNAQIFPMRDCEGAVLCACCGDGFLSLAAPANGVYYQSASGSERVSLTRMVARWEANTR